MPTLAPVADPTDPHLLRQTMVDCQIRTFDVTDQRLLQRFLTVPRETFVPEAVRELAYSDIGLSVEPSSPTGERRYLLPPMILARLIQGARVKPNDRVLVVAAGLGYSAAILCGLALEVVALEAPELGEGLEAQLAAFGAANVQALVGPLADGAPLHGPFDVILLSGAAGGNLKSLIAQLAEGGRLVTISVENRDAEHRAPRAVCFEKRGRELGTRFLFDVSTPPLRDFQVAPAFAF